MQGLLGLVSAEVESWPGVIAATHWNLYQRDLPDGADYYIGENEIGHLHFYGEAHVASDKAIREIFVKTGKAEIFRFGNTNSYQYWTQVMIDTKEKAQNAIDLFAANYRRLLSKRNDLFKSDY
jgi:hypothetical protein